MELVLIGSIAIIIFGIRQMFKDPPEYRIETEDEEAFLLLIDDEGDDGSYY